MWKHNCDSKHCWPTASGCGRPKCHVMAICTQDWLISGSVSMIRPMVTASLSVGGGCRMVQGVLGTHAHQSNYSTEKDLQWSQSSYSDDIQVMPVNLNLFLAPKTRFYLYCEVRASFNTRNCMTKLKNLEKL